MSAPSTPQKQVQLTKLEQLPTPPFTVVARKETAGIATHEHHGSGPHVRRLTYDAHVTQKIKNEDESSDPTLCDDSMKQCRGAQFPPGLTQTQDDQVRPKQEIEEQVAQLQLQNQEIEEKLPSPRRNQGKPEEVQDQQAAVTQKSEGKVQQLDKDGQPKSEVTRWLYGSATPEQRRQRFHSLLHATWPSNDEFNAARHPLYNPEEDGPYEFFLNQIWDGHCPYDDDDYNPFTDPSKSTEVWQPKIGEEGIEDEKDLRMVLKARQEHRARSEALKKRKADAVNAQLRAGVKYADIDMLQVFLGPEIESGDSDSDCESHSDYDKEEGGKKSEPPIQMGAPSTSTDSPFPGKPILQPTITAKGIRVFGGQEPSSGRGRPKGSKNKKGRKSNKRRRGPNDNPDGTYKYDSNSEDEQPIYRKAKRGKVAVGKAVDGDLVWQAQTRAAARRDQNVGMDGTYQNDDNENSTGAAFRTD
ncbi:hypothetical protein F5B21DRAFT_478771 [Xylaria acuta]|nr:hypothetical protein F5B21DRAFT_478771 [Xylaria acuta]